MNRSYYYFVFIACLSASSAQPGSSKQAKGSSSADGRCGCVGGCAFFGSNRNGPRFFQFTRQDVLEGLNTAQFRINGPGEDLGYGQSLLYARELVFNAAAYSNLVAPHFDMSGVHSSDHSSDHSAAHYRYNLSTGYSKGGGGASPLPSSDMDAKTTSRLYSYHPPPPSAYSRTLSQPQGDSAPSSSHQFRSLGRPGALRVPPTREMSPGRLG